MANLADILRALQSSISQIETLDPAEQDVAYRALLDHVRARRPESVGYLSQLPPPNMPIRDPRS